MAPAKELLGHFLALGLVWGWSFLAGLPLAALRAPLGFAGSVLLGMAFWAVSLYLFPFPHGLDCAAFLALAGAAAVWARRPVRRSPFLFRKPSLAQGILFAGCTVYVTLLCIHCVPPGMDASMHTTAARLIAEQQGLPRTYAPIAPQLFFPTVNLGLPALAAMAIRSGASPVSAMLACEQLTFSAFILACYLLLRLWTTRTPAALLAVFAVWTTRGAQETIGWGGFPTVASLALGLLATRLLIDLILRPAYHAAVPLGITVAALPLVHGVSAAGWIYAVAPVALAVGLVRTRQRWPASKALMASGGVAVLILLAYLFVGHTGLGPAEVAWTRDWQAGYAPEGEGWILLLTVPLYVKTFAGSVAVWGGLAGLVVLLVRKRFASVAALTVSAVLLCLLVANARRWVLPLSILLYPERVIYWATPLAALAMALAWQALPLRCRRSAVLAVVLVGGLLPFAVARHIHGFQRVAFHPEVTGAQWDALVWARDHLDPKQDYVFAWYNTAGSYLPAVAGIPTNAWHIHHFASEEARRAFCDRAPTHLFAVRSLQSADLSQGVAVFENRDVVILRLHPVLGKRFGQALNTELTRQRSR